MKLNTLLIIVLVIMYFNVLFYSVLLSVTLPPSFVFVIQVKNYIPSISAVTGITPQAYLWRTCIALHSAPRFAVTVIYYNHYMSRLHLIPAERVPLFKFLIKLNFWFNFVENSCLVLVAYITNRENYRKSRLEFCTSLFYKSEDFS